jgi:hypothetical protein
VPLSLERRRQNFFQGAPFVLLPAALLVPALKFLTICPPSYGKIIAEFVLVTFSCSEIWGLAKMFRCFSGKLDLIGLGAILCSVISLLVLTFSVWALTIRPT